MPKLKKSIVIVVALSCLLPSGFLRAVDVDNNITPLEAPVYSITLTAKQAKLGATITSPDKDFRLVFSPKAVSGETEIVLKKKNLDVDLPLNKTAISDYWEYDLGSKKINVKKPLVVQLRYQEGAIPSGVLFWGGQNWKNLKSEIIDAKNRIIQVYFPLAYSKFIVVGDSSYLFSGTASWYKYKGCDCAASPDYPKGSILLVTNLDNGKSVEVKINDYGPERDILPDRVIDLDSAAFKKIGKISRGLLKIKVEPIKIAK